ADHGTAGAAGSADTRDTPGLDAAADPNGSPPDRDTNPAEPDASPDQGAGSTAGPAAGRKTLGPDAACDHGAASAATAATTRHEWRLDLPPDPVLVPGDPHRLAQAVANLVGNARVHTPPGTRITVGI